METPWTLTSWHWCSLEETPEYINMEFQQDATFVDTFYLLYVQNLSEISPKHAKKGSKLTTQSVSVDDLTFKPKAKTQKCNKQLQTNKKINLSIPVLSRGFCKTVGCVYLLPAANKFSVDRVLANGLTILHVTFVISTRGVEVRPPAGVKVDTEPDTVAIDL